MKKVSAIVIMLIFLLCIPAYADELPQEETIVETGAVTGPAAEQESVTESATEMKTECGADASGNAQSESAQSEDGENATASELGNCRIVLDFPIAIPSNAAQRGLDPCYRVESSYTDDNGETWYVMAGRKGVVLKESDCSVQQYIDVDTDNLARQQVVASALERLGCPYAYGKAGPTSFDCSGFVQYCMKNVGVTVPRSSYSICSMDAKIDKNMLKAGDIVATRGHVGIYIGNGCFIHAQDHKNGVVTDFLDVYNAKSYKKFTDYINILD